MDQCKFSPCLVFFLGALFVFYQFLLQSSNSVMVTPLIQDLHIDLTDLGFLSASFFYTYVVLQIPAGILVDRFGAKFLVVGGLLVCACMAFIFGCVQHFAFAIGVRLLMGVASSPAVVGVMYLACRWFPPQRFALLAALVEMIGMLGGAIGESSLAVAVNMLGWRHSMMLVAFVGLVLALLCLLCLRNQPVVVEENHDCKVLALSELWRRFAIALKQREVWLGCLYGGASFSVISGFGGLWAIPFLENVAHLSLAESAFFSSLLFVGAAIGASSVGILVCCQMKIKALMLMASILAAVSLGLILFLPFNSLSNFVLFLVLGMSAGSYVLAFCYVKRNTCSTISGSAMGLTNMLCILLGAPILQPLVGHLLAYLTEIGKDSIIAYRFGMLPFLLCLLLAVGVAGLTREPKGLQDGAK